jgi:hypothetical protein
MKRRVALCVICLLAAVVSKGADDELARLSLKGLAGIHVVVEDLNQDATDAGLSVGALQTDAELKLRLAGISVLNASEQALGFPYLYIVVVVQSRDRALYYYSISAEIWQHTRLTRSPTTEVWAATWSTALFIGSVGETTFTTAVRAAVKDRVDKFINAWLAVNPKR